MSEWRQCIQCRPALLSPICTRFPGQLISPTLGGDFPLSATAIIHFHQQSASERSPGLIHTGHWCSCGSSVSGFSWVFTEEGLLVRKKKYSFQREKCLFKNQGHSAIWATYCLIRMLKRTHLRQSISSGKMLSEASFFFFWCQVQSFARPWNEKDKNGIHGNKTFKSGVGN